MADDVPAKPGAQQVGDIDPQSVDLHVIVVQDGVVGALYGGVNLYLLDAIRAYEQDSDRCDLVEQVEAGVLESYGQRIYLVARSFLVAHIGAMYPAFSGNQWPITPELLDRYLPQNALFYVTVSS